MPPITDLHCALGAVVGAREVNQAHRMHIQPFRASWRWHGHEFIANGFARDLDSTFQRVHSREKPRKRPHPKVQIVPVPSIHPKQSQLGIYAFTVYRDTTRNSVLNALTRKRFCNIIHSTKTISGLKMPITIEQVSQKTGLSVSTVSKAMNDYPDIAPETKKRVLQAARELNYHPSAAARNLRRKHTSKIGFVLPFAVSYISEYVSELITGAAMAAEATGYNLVLYINQPNQHEQLAKICRAREVDGLLLRGTDHVEETFALLDREEIPFVITGRRVDHPRASFIVPDNFGGAVMLMRHLIELGHTRIAFTARPALFESNTDRMAGYCEGLREAGIAVDRALIVETSVEPRSGYRAMNQLLDLSNPPTALFAIHDLIAIDAMQAAFDRGLRVPEDISIASFDGIQSTQITKPPITTVRQPITDIGKRAVEILLARIADHSTSPVREIVPVQLIVRESTARAK